MYICEQFLDVNIEALSLSSFVGGIGVVFSLSTESCYLKPVLAEMQTFVLKAWD
jgi:hypothetical protein